MLFFMKKKLYRPFHGWGSTASWLEWEPHWRGSLLFTIKFPEIAGTHFSSTSDRQTTQILKSDPKKGVLVVVKMLFPQVDEGFWLYYTDTEISKLILCFSILLLHISCWVKKNLARLRGENILSSRINAQLIMINSLHT